MRRILLYGILICSITPVFAQLGTIRLGPANAAMDEPEAIEGIWSVSMTLTVFINGEREGSFTLPHSGLVRVRRDDEVLRAKTFGKSEAKSDAFTLRELDGNGNYEVEFRDPVTGFNVRGEASLNGDGNLELSLFMSEEWHVRAAEIMGNWPDKGYSSSLVYQLEKLSGGRPKAPGYASNPSENRNPMLQ